VTVDDVFQALRDRGAVLMLQDGGLRYIGPVRLAPDDPIRAGIGEHRAMLIELFTYARRAMCRARLLPTEDRRAGDLPGPCGDDRERNQRALSQ
jgi:hypothetical protein